MFVSGYAGQAAMVRLFNSTASVPVGAAVVQSPVVTDGVGGAGLGPPGSVPDSNCDIWR